MLNGPKYLVVVEATRYFETVPPRTIDRKSNSIQQRVYWALGRTCSKTPLGWIADDVALAELGERLAPVLADADEFNKTFRERGWTVRVGAYPLPLRTAARVPGIPTAFERIKEGGTPHD